MKNRMLSSDPAGGTEPMVSEPGLIDRSSAARAPCGCYGRWVCRLRAWTFRERGPGWEHQQTIETWVWEFFVVTPGPRVAGCAGREDRKNG